MKRVRTLSTMVALAALIVPTQSAAQITLGFGGGVTRSNISVEPDEDFDSNSSTGIFVGAFLGVPLTGALSVTVGGVTSERGLLHFGALWGHDHCRRRGGLPERAGDPSVRRGQRGSVDFPSSPGPRSALRRSVRSP